MASLVLKAVADLTFARKKLCSTEPWSVGCIVDIAGAIENVKVTQRNNENDWHKDCNKTQQHHWHLVCFQPKRRGSLPHTKAY